MGGDEGRPGNNIGVWDLVEEAERVGGVAVAVAVAVVGFGVEGNEVVVEELVQATMDNGPSVYNPWVGVGSHRRQRPWRFSVHCFYK